MVVAVLRTLPSILTDRPVELCLVAGIRTEARVLLRTPGDEGGEAKVDCLLRMTEGVGEAEVVKAERVDASCCCCFLAKKSARLEELVTGEELE